MAKKKKSKKEKEQIEETAPEEALESATNEEAEEPVEVKLISADEYDALKEELASAKAELENKQDELLRSVAEFSNYKKRLDRDLTLQKVSMKGNIVKRFLPAMDDLLRALKNAPDDPWVEGIQLIYRKMEGILEAEGIERIEAEGLEFDPNFHEAVSQVESDEYESGFVVEVLQQGYQLDERVIRPAIVVVAA